MLGFASPHPEAVNKPVVATILTSCSDGFQILDLPQEDVYSTAIHEFAHTLGLGHTFNIDYDLMCSYDWYPNGEEKQTCANSETTGKLQPSENDIQALLYKYGNNGFSLPNRDLFGEGGGLRPVFKITDTLGNLSIDSRSNNEFSSLTETFSDDNISEIILAENRTTDSQLGNLMWMGDLDLNSCIR
ncbi:hypothetical protein [Candidatus Nitrosocosmicus arcticus]|uniref:Uncharacterized protein n=1 Tax=Candidatus Nitrosocosmicus arcticus TaxID=2035267 RepID=A0A557STW8_9ARCH|nr:hypothetical protein [Candidatus Nitrosocosmicus arcticus]TVP40040.1 hypothetical protein NARC_100102 [Candidatus Nitrosocosmicus arcticus]